MSVRIMHLREKEHPGPEHFICKKNNRRPSVLRRMP